MDRIQNDNEIKLALEEVKKKKQINLKGNRYP
jgi:hypothetical protein